MARGRIIKEIIRIPLSRLKGTHLELNLTKQTHTKARSVKFQNSGNKEVIRTPREKKRVSWRGSEIGTAPDFQIDTEGLFKAN